MPAEVGTGAGGASSDAVSLADRMRSLSALRLGFAVVVAVLGLAFTHVAPGARPGLELSSGVYAGLEVAAEALRRRGGGRRLPLLAFGVLLDGVFLAWSAFLTGGAASPLQALLFVQVVAISLLASYRTGLKVAIWDSLLLLTFAYAQAAGAIPPPGSIGVLGVPPMTSAVQMAAITVVALWGVAVATAALSAVNERTLRRKRADLEALSRMVGSMGERDSAEAIPRVLIESLHETFGVARGAVLASREGDLALLASLGIDVPATTAEGFDRVVERALTSRTVQLVRRLDPEGDPRLSAMVPDAQNVMVVPMFLSGGFRLGVLVVERAGRSDRIHGWTVAMIQEFASKAAVTLHNAWLLEDNQRKLDENRRLRDQLLAQNLSLEARVIERTRELADSVEQLRGSNAERQRLLSHLVRAQEDERRRIAGDIHDDPLQLLVAVTMRLDILRRGLDDVRKAGSVSEVREMTRTVIARLRNLMFELRPPILEEQGLAAAIRAYAEQWNLGQEIVIHDRFQEEPPDEPRLILYRISQEAFANIRKHSEADRVVVTLEDQGGSFVVRIVDDGVGFTPGQVAGAAQGHIGLTSMRERAELAGGGCRIHSLSGGGTTVEFWLPRSVEDVDAVRTSAALGERA